MGNGLIGNLPFAERRSTDFSSQRGKLGQFMPLILLLEDFACAALEGFYMRPNYDEIGQDLVVSTFFVVVGFFCFGVASYLDVSGGLEDAKAHIMRAQQGCQRDLELQRKLVPSPGIL